MRRSLLGAGLLGLLALLPACRAPRLSGTSVGQYEVNGELVENTCAEGYPAPETLRFFVELRHDAGVVGYWKLANSPIVEGRVERMTGFRFVEASQVVAVPADPTMGVTGCTLAREETVEGTLMGEAASDAGIPLDGGAPAVPPGETRFEGTTTVQVSASRGDCSALVTTAGGPFPALPCVLRFDLVGEQLDEPLW